MKFLSRLIASILSLVVILSVSAFILAGTIWNAPRLQAAAEAAGFSDKVTEALPSALKGSLALSEDESFILKTVVTKDRIKPVIDQILAAFAAPDGTAIEVDLSEFRRGIVNENLPLTASLDQFTSQKFTVIPTEQAARLAEAKSKLDQAKLWGPIIAAILIVLILVLAKHSRFIVLGQTAIMVALGLGLLGLLLPSLPGIVTSSLDTSAAAPLRDTVTEFLRSLFTAAQGDYYLAAIIAAGASVGLFILHYVAAFIGKFRSKKKH